MSRALASALARELQQVTHVRGGWAKLLERRNRNSLASVEGRKEVKRAMAHIHSIRPP